MKETVQVFEVGPRDGLQNEQKILSLRDKVELIQSLIQAGVRDVEIGAFVRPDRVPQMANTEQVYETLHRPGVRLGKARTWCLVPNQVGLERALRVGVKEIAVFTAATDTFNVKNIGMTIRQSLKEIDQLIRHARAHVGPKLQIRGYVSTAFGCPFEGKVRPSAALHVVDRLIALGVDQISIGDTIGVATPLDIKAVIAPATKRWGAKMVAIHLHDTRGTALANALQAIELGVRIIDSSVGGLGGCPFAPGASGNLATEDLVYMLNGMGIESGIDLDRLCQASLKMTKKMKRPITSRYLQAHVTARKRLNSRRSSVRCAF